MNDKKRFLLRLSPEVHAAIERWAADELRSMNGQIEWALKDALRRAGRIGVRPPRAGGGGGRPESA